MNFLDYFYYKSYREMLHRKWILRVPAWLSILVLCELLLLYLCQAIGLFTGDMYLAGSVLFIGGVVIFLFVLGYYLPRRKRIIERGDALREAGVARFASDYPLSKDILIWILILYIVLFDILVRIL